MRKTITHLIASVAIGSVSAAAFADDTVSIKYRYKQANNGKMHNGLVSKVSVPNVIGSSATFMTHGDMAKGLLVLDIAKAIEASLTKYQEECRAQVIPVPHPFPRPLPGPVHPPSVRPLPPIMPGPVPLPTPQPSATCVQVSKDLFKNVDRFHAQVKADRVLLNDNQLVDAVELVRTLAKSMESLKDREIYDPRMGLELARSTTLGGAKMAAVGLNVTAGGALDAGQLIKNIKDGRVPHPENFVMEGFLSEFDLGLASQTPCQQLICVTPAVAVDGAAKKMYVQVAMDSNVTEKTFKRRALNLSLVIDISGSMGASDGTEKSRMEWAKEAALHTIEQLGDNDLLSIVLFNDQSATLLNATAMDSAAKLNATRLVKEIKSGGSTNLHAGLADGYDYVSTEADQERENRVILITDANLNTGVTEVENFNRLVSDHAAEGIGLTAIGVGVNFNQEFVHAITMSRGGNYIFAQTGKQMFKFFRSFDFLVTPVAYDFKASLELDGLKGELVGAYGIPAKKGEPIRELINIRTLFFSGEAGGAMMLEYDLN